MKDANDVRTIDMFDDMVYHPLTWRAEVLPARKKWRKPASCLDSAYERKAIEDGHFIPNTSRFPENVE